MRCPYCRSSIFTGSFECRYCGKKLPQPKSVRIPGRMLIGILVAIAGLIAYSALFRTDNQREDVRLHQAAACNGRMTAQQIEAVAKDLSIKTRIPLADALHGAELKACPTMTGG